MIVQCTNCKAKFRIADEKVPDKGAKVRCPKCSTVFRAMREGTMPPPSGLDGPDLPALVGKPTKPPQESAQLSDALRDAFASAGLNAPVTASSLSIEKVMPQAPTAASLTYGAANSADALDLGLDSENGLPPLPQGTPPGMLPAPIPAAPPKRSPPTSPMRGLTPTLQQASAWNASALDAALDAAMSSAAAGRSGGALPTPGLPDLSTTGLTPRPERGRPIVTAPPPVRRTPTPAPPTRSLDDELNLAFSPSPSQMDAEIPPATMPPPPSNFGQAPAPGPPPAFLSPPPPRVQAPFTAAPAADPNDIWAELSLKPAREETDPFAGLDSRRAVVPGATIALVGPSPTVIPAETLKPQNSPVSTKAQALLESDELGEVSGGAPAFDAGRIPTSAREIELREASMGQKLDLDLGFGNPDFIQRPAPIPQDAMDAASSAGVDLGRFAPQSRPPPTSRSGTNPTARKERLRRDFASGLLNVLSAAFVLYAGIVAIAVIRTPRQIRLDDVGFPMVWLALGGGSGTVADQLRTTSVHSGIYPVNTGDDLFYVEGTAQNESSGRREAMSVTVEILRGSHVIKEADAIVGLKAMPEDLYDLSSRDNADLQHRLAEHAPTFVVEPYKSAPFVGIFPMHAADVAGTEIRVVVHDGLPASMKALIAGGARHAQADPVPTRAPDGDAAKSP